MSQDMQLVHSSEFPRFKSGRRSLSEEWAAAAQGAPPQQAAHDPAVLFADAQIIQKDADNLTRRLAKVLGGIAEMGPEKNLYRVLAKFSGKDDGKDPSFNCDFSRSRILLRNKSQIRNAIDMFASTGMLELKDGTRFMVREVEQNFTTLNKRKAGLANMDVKITFEFTTAEGERSFHHHELQFMPAEAKADYQRSHEVYERKRVAQIYRDGADNALAICGPSEAEGWSKKWRQYDAQMQAAQVERWAIHMGVRERLGLDELIGYQPCNSCKAKKLEKPGANLYVVQ